MPQKSSAYISQNDVHIAEMTVREAINFSACCQGSGIFDEILLEVMRREKEAGIVPDIDVDSYMKAISVKGQKTNLQTDYILKILGLDVCAETLVGDTMRRGISGGQMKRLTTGEMIVVPTKVLFADEISNGLDSSTTFRIVSCLQQLAHIMDVTVLISLQQPAPETFDLFDDIILMAEGKIIYQGTQDDVLEFFEDCGFRCPRTKEIADFLQEVISRKDQAQYWCRVEQAHNYTSVDMFSQKFMESHFGKKLNEELSEPFKKSESHKDPVSFSLYSLSKWALFKACMSREILLMRRNSFLYIFKLIQLMLIAFITVTLFLRTQMDIDIVHANFYLGTLFFSLVVVSVNSFPELHMTVVRLPVFYKQRDLYFYPAWAYALPTIFIKIPLSIIDSVVWTSLTYYLIGFAPEIGRFFRQLILNFAIQLTSTSMFCFLASSLQTMDASLVAGSLSVLVLLLFGGFIIPKSSMPIWIRWGFWLCPLTYGHIGLAVNEFLAPRWQKMQVSNATIGQETLHSHGLNFNGSFFWISVGALFGFVILFNVGFTLALAFLKSPSPHVIISSEKLSQIQKSNENSNSKTIKKPVKGEMVLPFEPLTLAFRDVEYYIDTTSVMKEQGLTQKRLRLLCEITGSLRPGVLTALMGVSGAGKTTLLDVLAGRKTTGSVEGEIKIGGYPKFQESFARVLGYCEQTDIHSPHITVEESVIYSAWLRLHPQIDSKTKSEFVNEVLETIELAEIKNVLVGIPGVNGLSIEQRKRLTIAVELVANPSIIFMDEPTTGLDARAAATVMRSVKNVADMGRTIVCTIHQPSIEIFETFGELILLSMGGHVIYSGPLGRHSSEVIKYFEGISTVPRIRSNYNPAAWILEITSTSAGVKFGVDFSQIYKKSALYKSNKDLVERLCIPSAASKELHFPTRFAQNGWVQFKLCLWKMHLSYWRNPSYNLGRFMYLIFASLLLGIVFWDQGTKIHNQQSLFNILGSMYLSVLFCGTNNSTSVVPNVSTERTIFYRERFTGMYTSSVYAIAQVIVEVPYLFAQAVAFTMITYPMIGYYWSTYKLFWYFYAMFCNLLYYTYFGMLLVSLTPSCEIAAAIQSASYTIFNLFVGFLIPRPQMPKWWVWLYYVVPTSWALNGMLTSQYGDIDKEMMVFGETRKIAVFLQDYFGFHHDQLPIVGGVLILYPILFSSFFAYCIEKLNFQKR